VNIERRSIFLAGHLCISWAILSWPLALMMLSLLQFLPEGLSDWWFVREVAIPPVVYLMAFWPCALGGLGALATLLLAARSRMTPPAIAAAFALISAAGLYSASAFVLTRFHSG